MVYVVVAYPSFIQIESVWIQRSEGEDPIGFSLLSPLFAVPVNLLYPPHFQIFHGVVRLAEVGRDWLFVFFVLMSEQCPFILACRAFSISPTQPHYYFLAAFTPFVASVVAGVGWGGWCGSESNGQGVPSNSSGA